MQAARTKVSHVDTVGRKRRRGAREASVMAVIKFASRFAHPVMRQYRGIRLSAVRSKITMSNDPFLTALARMGLLQPGEIPAIAPLAGGVSSDIVRVDLKSGPICIKRALPKLKVQADWLAPVERNQYEIEWMRVAAGIDPQAVPKVLGEDRDTGMFAMEFLDAERYPVWKTQLRDGEISIDTAREVGRRIAAIHGRTAGHIDVAAKFSTDHIFFPIRLEPYLCATAKKHPDCAERLESLVRVTGATKKALVHGDVSPKNILAGPNGPVFLDAECAWYGDPAFDLARTKANEIADYLRRHGPFMPARLGPEEMEYTTLHAVLEKLEGRFKRAS